MPYRSCPYTCFYQSGLVTEFGRVEKYTIKRKLKTRIDISDIRHVIEQTYVLQRCRQIRYSRVAVIESTADRCDK